MRIGMHVGCCVEKRDQVTATHSSPAKAFSITHAYALSTLRLLPNVRWDLATPELVIAEGLRRHLTLF
jgi:hypothetical protein